MGGTPRRMNRSESASITSAEAGGRFGADLDMASNPAAMRRHLPRRTPRSASEKYQANACAAAARLSGEYKRTTRNVLVRLCR
jgi:hypothetical protein